MSSAAAVDHHALTIMYFSKRILRKLLKFQGTTQKSSESYMTSTRNVSFSELGEGNDVITRNRKSMILLQASFCSLVQKVSQFVRYRVSSIPDCLKMFKAIQTCVKFIEAQ